MTRDNAQRFSQKHSPDATLDSVIKDKTLANAKSGELACAVAFKIAAEINTPPAEIGKAADLLDLKLVECQLGLFGYTPAKKIVNPARPQDPELEDAIRGAVVDGAVSCRDAWAMARSNNVSKMAVSAACEALKIKIKPCQLGAF